MGKIDEIHQMTHTKFLNFFELDTTKKNGKHGKYFVASRAKDINGLEISRKKTKADGVVMYVLCGEKHDKVLLIRQFRWPIDDYVYEFPAGLVEKGENFHQAAKRELWEETGLTFEPLHVDPMYERPYYMTDGMTDEACALVYGYADDKLKPQHLEDSEEIEVVMADRDKAREILKSQRAAANCAYMLMRFIHDDDPFYFLKDDKNN